MKRPGRAPTALYRQIADFLGWRPGSSSVDIEQTFVTGAVSKVMADMQRIGYVFHKGWASVPCTSGRTRPARTYILVSAPASEEG